MSLPRSRKAHMNQYLAKRDFARRVTGLQQLLDTNGGHDRVVEFVRADGFRYYKTIVGDTTPATLTEARAVTKHGQFYTFLPTFAEIVATLKDETWESRYVVVSSDRGTAYVRIQPGAEVPATLAELKKVQVGQPATAPTGWIQAGVIQC